MTVSNFILILFALIILAMFGLLLKVSDKQNKQIEEAVEAVNKAVQLFGRESDRKEARFNTLCEDVRNNLWVIYIEMRRLNKFIAMHHTVEPWDKDIWEEELQKDYRYKKNL